MEVDSGNMVHDIHENVSKSDDINTLMTNLAIDNNLSERSRLMALSSKIKLCDTDLENALELFCYSHCDNDENPIIKNSRGVIFDGNNEKIFQGFPYTDEYVIDEKITEGTLDFIFSTPESSKFRFFPSTEGTLLRIFFYKKWYISTHRKLDAFRSKWSSRDSFGQIFVNSLFSLYNKDEHFKKRLGDNLSEENILTAFLNTLDTNNQYIILLGCTSDNRIVCAYHDDNALFHVGTYSNNQQEFNLDDNIGLRKSVELFFTNYASLINYVKNSSFEEKQGIIVFHGNNYTQQLKLVNKEYNQLYQARGNEPSIKFRYLQVRKDKDAVDALYYLYPKFADTFDDYEYTLSQIARKINNAYISRFIKRKHIVVPKEEYTVMRSCHEWHLQDRERNRISLQKVSEILNNQSASQLNKMIRLHKNSDKEFTPSTRPRARSHNEIKTVSMEVS